MRFGELEEHQVGDLRADPTAFDLAGQVDLPGAFEGDLAGGAWDQPLDRGRGTGGDLLPGVGAAGAEDGGSQRGGQGEGAGGGQGHRFFSAGKGLATGSPRAAS